MLIAVVSDTHRDIYYIKKVRELIKNADILIHLGDNVDDIEVLTKDFNGLVYAVKGNCDFAGGFPSEQIIEVKGTKIFITHGHKYGVKYDLNNLYFKAREVEAKMALFGHTHTSQIEEECGIILMNPGSASMPRMSKHSIGYIEIDEHNNIYPYIREI